LPVLIEEEIKELTRQVVMVCHVAPCTVRRVMLLKPSNREAELLEEFLEPWWAGGVYVEAYQVEYIKKITSIGRPRPIHVPFSKSHGSFGDQLSPDAAIVKQHACRRSGL